MSSAVMADRLRCFDDADRGSVAAETYRTLRLGMVVLIGALFSSIAVEAVRVGDLRVSISDYFYSPVHGIFLATICAMGALLIVYRGNSQVEDGLLNSAGFLAFLVAVIPTGYDRAGAEWTLPGGDSLADGVANDFAVVVGAGVLAELVWFFHRRYPGQAAGGRPTWWVYIAHASGPIVVAVLVIMYWGWREEFARYGHAIAAISMFALLCLAVFCNAVTARGPRYSNVYGAVGTVMVVATAVCVVLGFAGVTLFWLETVLLVAFAAFWIVQTVELRGRMLR